jgi:aspartyl-tRNA(Asn)/glutamyl-tRNA(Gln) amidotransferase subunit B
MGGLRGGEALAMTTTEQDLYETTVGLEIHVELSTASKMFCGCAVRFGGEPNTRTCPVCLGLPGSLPVPNEQAIENTMKIALALNCHIVERSVFHRKNYFYPDMPKNYQISQYDYPLGSQGVLEISGDFGTTRVGINRVHLEEDTGKSIHVGGSGRIADSEYSLEDFNRAGTPLVEIVSEPDIHSAEEARVFVSELRSLLESLGVSDVRMEEGSMRVDANVSVRLRGETEHGAKVEVKNMNSIRSVGRALEYEEKRQREALRNGERLIQETRHFDEKTGTTSSMRTKEFAFDYRYFVEPDLVPFEPGVEWVERVRASLGETPVQRRERFAREYGLGEKDIEVLTSSPKVADYFEGAAKAYEGEAKKVANWILADLFGLANEAGIEVYDSKVAPEQIAGLVKLIDDGRISGKQGKQVLGEMFANGKDADAIAAERGLEQVSDTGQLEAFVDEAIAENPDVAEKIRGGQMGAIGFLVGQVMKKSRGQANPGVVNGLIKDKLTS